MDKRRILFVDDEPGVLAELEQTLAGMRERWDMEFVTDPLRALARLDADPFDVVISDSRMPGMNGGQFLGEVMLRHPRAVRIILSRPMDRDDALEALNASHQFLAKPCNAETLKAAVTRALALRKLLAGDTPLKSLISRLDSLPSMPALYTRVVQELQSPRSTADSVAAIVAQDPAMTAKILQLVNSAFFSLSRHVSDLPTAIVLLGLDTIRALVLSVQVFSQFDPQTLQALSVDTLWQHSVRVGALAKRLASSAGVDREMVSDALTAGLLHDVGKLILAANLPNIYVKVAPLAQAEGIPECEAERRLFGAAHGETGAYLLGLWGLPEPIVEAVAYHHHPQDRETRELSALAFVHTANALCSMTGTARLDRAYLDELGLGERIDAWSELAAGDADD